MNNNVRTNRGESPLRGAPPARIVQIEAMLDPESESSDEVVELAARWLDVELLELQTVEAWVQWLDALRVLPTEAAAAEQELEMASTPSHVLRTVYDRGAERGICDGLISPAELHGLLLDPDALRILLELKSCDDETRQHVHNALECIACSYERVAGPEPSGPTDLIFRTSDEPDAEHAADRADEFTPVVLSATKPLNEQLRRRVAEAVFPLLEEVGIEVDASRQSEKGTLLLRELVGRESLGRFHELKHWLDNVRVGSIFELPMLLLQSVAEELFETTADGEYRRRLSFRLFMRSRVADFCRKEGWQPSASSGHAGLEAALASLTRARIGEMLDNALGEVNELFRQAHDAGEFSELGIEQDKVAEAMELARSG
jgi:hypothetical protein